MDVMKDSDRFFIILATIIVVFFPLGLWKLAEIVFWLFTKVEVTIK